MIFMNKNGRNIHSYEEWCDLAIRRKLQSKEGRSARLLAKAWFKSGTPQLPTELTSILHTHMELRDFQADIAIPELITKLDMFRGGRNHDLIIDGHSKGIRTLISIEAKVDEEFGRVISKYLRSVENKKFNVPERIKNLSTAILGVKDATPHRYQLLHATAGTLIEAKERLAERAILIVHEFIPNQCKSKRAIQNENDLIDFFNILTDGKQSFETGKLLGPIHVPGGGMVPSDIPLYIGKIESLIN